MKFHPAGVGAVIWVAFTARFELSMIEALFLWAPLVVVTLGLDVIRPEGGLGRVIQIAQPLAAILVGFSFAFQPGLTAAAFVAPWALVTFAMALLGAKRFFGRKPRNPVETFVDAALGLIAVGGWGLVMSRAGLKPAGFTEPIVLLTAVHFHYTGFAAPLLIGLAGRRAGPKRAILAAGAAVITATPLLAIGFTMRQPELKLVATIIIATGLALFAWELVRIAVEEPNGQARALVGIAAFSIFWGMALAGLYSVGEFRESLFIDIPGMAWSHGILNAFGFATCGLLGARVWRA